MCGGEDDEAGLHSAVLVSESHQSSFISHGVAVVRSAEHRDALTVMQYFVTTIANLEKFKFKIKKT